MDELCVFAVLDNQPQICTSYRKEMGLVDALTLISLLNPIVQAVIHQHLMVREAALSSSSLVTLIHYISLSAPR